MCYNWIVYDDDQRIKSGADHKLNYIGRIGGGSADVYNTKFTVEGALGEYHVKFRAGSKRVAGIRYVPSGGSEGDNLMRLESGKGKTLRDLDTRGYPNSAQLVKNLRNALQGVGEKNGEYVDP